MIKLDVSPLSLQMVEEKEKRREVIG